MNSKSRFAPSKNTRISEDPTTADTLNDRVVLETVGAKRTAPHQVSEEPPSKKQRIDDISEDELRYQEEAWSRAVENKVEDERERVRKEYETFDSDSQALYTLFHDLQMLTTEYGLDFKTPEIVVVGMQSDGKSTFIEGLLGFQFNIVDTNIGTRRPLIIQMVNDPECDTPICRFKREDDREDGSSDEDGMFENETYPVNKLSMELMRRTDKKTGKNKHCVSDSPIVLRVRFAKCANLTIYDTPGFRLGGVDSLRRDIEDMVMKLIQPEHRIIVCLEQSTIEWANTNSRPFVQRVDPNLERTVVVCTKFDNRVKEMRDPDSTNSYLEGEGLPNGVRPFFISMPVPRNLTPIKFSSVTQNCYLNDYRQLLEVKFDEKRFVDRLGFHRVKRYIERLLKQKYMESLKPTLATLEKWCDDSRRQLADIDRILAETDVENHIQRSREFVYTFHRLVRECIQGGLQIDIPCYGFTTLDERLRSGVHWPIDNLPDYDIPLGREKLLAASQYARLFKEMEFVLRTVKSPSLSTADYAESLAGGWNIDRASSELVKRRILEVLRPFIAVSVRRVCFILKCLFEPIVKELEREEPTRPWRIVASCDGFSSWMRNQFESFVDNIEQVSTTILIDQFSTFSSCLDWDIMLDMEQVKQQTSNEDIKEQVQRTMQQRQERQSKRSTLIVGPDADPQKIQTDFFKAVDLEYKRKFEVVQEFFILWLKNVLHAHCLRPIKDGDMQRSGIEKFIVMSNDRDAFEAMFNASTIELRRKQTCIEEQMQKLVQQRDRFKNLCQQMTSL